MVINSVKLPHHNNAAESKTIKLDIPSRVIINLSQNIGVPCEPVVKVGENVKTGQIIGESSAFVSAPIHASVTGQVVAIGETVNINGYLNKTIEIESINKQELHESVAPPIVTDRESFIKSIYKSGAVGLGGAGFPTHVKLAYDRTKFKIDTLVVNGAECEPYITSDYREFMENPDSIINGIKQIMKYLEINRAVIGIEKDKPKAISIMNEKLSNESNITVIPLKTKYPQGSEKILINTTTKRVVKDGLLPMSVGCLVINSSTASFLAEYLETGEPLIKRRITIDGNIVNKPLNIIVPVGLKLSDILNYVNLRSQPDRVIFGGTMMGNCVYDLNSSIGKTTSAVLLFGKTKFYKRTPCIKCGRCINVCPMNLSPLLLESAYNERNLEKLNKLRLNTCMACGSCTYICPAKRNLAEINQIAKGFLRDNF